MSDGTAIVDTNVLLVAAGRHEKSSTFCRIACVVRLQETVAKGRVALDSGYEIISEYQSKIDTKRGKDPGTAFLKWLLRNKHNRARCDLIVLDKTGEGDYADFPRDDELSGFDPSDRKFVALAAAHPGHPPILQASDTKWLEYHSAMEQNGIRVDFLCPEDLRGFRKASNGR